MQKALSLVLLLFVGVQVVRAQHDQGLRYIYDAAGRMIGTLDANGTARSYTYDAADRLVAIDQFKANGTVDVLFVTANRRTVGTMPSNGVTAKIYGVGFSATPSQNQVTINGMPAIVESSTPGVLTARLPCSATSGRVTVITPAGKATSRTDFKVSASVDCKIKD